MDQAVREWGVEVVRLGCPLNNLAQEMSIGLRQAVVAGQVRADVEGCIGLAKNVQSPTLDAGCLRVLREYVEGLRA